MRIAILGNSGSGKSTLARRLAREARAPHLDLDTIVWEPQKIAIAREKARVLADLRAFCEASESWVVEGCYADVIEACLVYHPRLLLLNPGVDVCLEHARSRPWEPHKLQSKEKQDELLAFQLTWIADYPSREGPMGLAAHRGLFHAYTGEKRELVDRDSYA